MISVIWYEHHLCLFTDKVTCVFSRQGFNGNGANFERRLCNCNDSLTGFSWSRWSFLECSSRVASGHLIGSCQGGIGLQ